MVIQLNCMLTNGILILMVTSNGTIQQCLTIVRKSITQGFSLIFAHCRICTAVVLLERIIPTIVRQVPTQGYRQKYNFVTYRCIQATE